MSEATHIADIVFEQISRKIQATTRPPSGDTTFALLKNNCTVREPCGVCGLSQKDIAAELGLNKSTVSRTMKKAEETGLLPSPNAAEKYATRRG